VALLSIWQGRIYSNNAFLTPALQTQIFNGAPATRTTTDNTTGVAEQVRYAGFGVFLPNNETNPIGDTRQITRNTMHQATVGFKADISSGWLEGWKVDGYLQKATNRQDFNTINGIRVDRLWLALDAVKDPSGNIVCRAALPQYDPNGYLKGCAPINLFGGVRNITPEAAAWVRDPYKVAAQWVDQTVAEVSTSGKLGFGLPAGDISAAFGASYRKDALDQKTVDPADEYPALPDGRLFSSLGLAPASLRGLVPQGQSGGVAGYTGFPGLRFVGSGYLGDSNSSSVQFSSLRTIAGDANVKEGFAEFQIPLLKDLPFARNLQTNIAARYANYSGSGSIWAYKAGVNWEINDQIRLRATRSRDVRAATLQERYDQTRGGITVTDPANSNVLTSAASFSGGNAAVNPEKADTTTAGFVWQPAFLEGFQTSADWYSISIADAIAQLPGQTIVNNCAAGDTTLCQYVIRVGGTPTGTIERVDALFINLAQQKISGVDVEMSYRKSVSLLGNGPESISMRLYATELMSNSTQNRGAPKDQRAGQIGGGFALPKQKATMNVSYTNGPYTAFVQGRYIGDGKLERTWVESPVAIAGKTTIDNNHVGSVFYTDLNLRYSWEALGDMQVYANITNLFDRAPPSDPAAFGRTGSSEVNPIIHDQVGRRYVIGVNYKF
jgi:outer membrane receptor protein involved in Fe transport